MQRTIYSTLTSADLVEFATQRDNATPMEIELAQRLSIAMAMLEEHDEYDAGRESEERRQKTAG